MGHFETKSQRGFTLIQLLLLILCIGILAMIVSFTWRFFNNKNSPVEQALKEAKSALIEAQTQAKKQNISYTVSFQNNAGIAQYSIYSEKNSPNGWKNLSNDSSVVTNTAKVSFDSQGNVEKTGIKVVLTFNKENKCLLVKMSLEEIKNLEGAECN